MKNQDQVLEFLRLNGKSGVDAIVEGTGIHKLSTFKILKGLVEKDKSVVMDKEQFGFVYSLVGNEGVVAPPNEESPKEEGDDELDLSKPKMKVVEKAPSHSGKDFTKYKLVFEGTKLEGLTKGRLALQIVKLYVGSKKGISLKALKEVFPDTIVKINSYGLVQELNFAQKKSETGHRDRYFMKPEEVIKLKDKTIAVCNQISLKEITVIIGIAKTLGMKVSVAG
jgi:hypothetical protein